MKLSDLIDDYLGRGKSTFTKEEALRKTGLSESAFYKASSRFQNKNKLFQPRQGFFVIVRPEDRNRKGPSPYDFIDQLMDYLGKPYYVGVLSAAKLHGAAHHQPMEFQVVSLEPMQDIEEGRTVIRFIENSKIDVVPVNEEKVRTGYINVSTPEATVVDAVYYRKHAAGMNNVANIIIELAGNEKLEPSKLFEASMVMHGKATIQRLGYLLDEFGFRELSKPLEKWVRNNDVTRVPLIAGGDRSGVPHDKRWNILVNTELDPDVAIPSRSR